MRSGTARVNEGSYSFTCPHTFIHKWNEPYLPFLNVTSVALLVQLHVRHLLPKNVSAHLPICFVLFYDGKR